MSKKYLRTLSTLLAVFAFSSVLAFAQVPAGDYSVTDAAIDSVVTVLLAADGQTQAVGTGLVVRSDGYILTAYSLVRGAHEIQVRLRNGEIYDKAEIVSTDERRNIAILRIKAVGLRVIPNGTVEESQVGSRVSVLANPVGQAVVKNTGMLKSVQMANDVPGAGNGYRILQIDAIAGVNAAGGLLLDEVGRSLGIITTTPEIKGQNIAVPLSSLVGLIRSVPMTNSVIVTAVPGVSTGYSATQTQTPYPIPQGSVFVPERGITPLSAKGPGSVVVKPKTVPEILAASKTIYVTSRTISFKPDQMINALNKRKEMAEWGLTFVDERELADLILELDHVLFTWKYTFKIYSQRLGTVVATGSNIILDGNLGADDMANRVIDKLRVARGPDKKVPNVKEPETKKTDEKKTDG
jgi:S1-C subfamily serine protease